MSTNFKYYSKTNWKHPWMFETSKRIHSFIQTYISKSYFGFAYTLLRIVSRLIYSIFFSSLPETDSHFHFDCYSLFILFFRFNESFIYSDSYDLKWSILEYIRMSFRICFIYKCCSWSGTAWSSDVWCLTFDVSNR